MSCGADFKAADPKSPGHPDLPAADDESLDGRTILRSIGLISVLVLAVVGVFGIVVWATRETPTPPAVTNRPTDQAKGQPADAVKSAKEARSAAVGVLLFALVILAAVLAVGYYVTMLTAGAWVARDAGRRGMSGLGWASFYYLFHTLTRLLAIPFLVVPSLLLGSFAWVLAVGAEAVAWFGLAVYFAARRPGRLVPCPTCRCRRLNYLLVCPMCGG